MAVMHRSLFAWFITVLFAILAVLRLDSKASWNWFIIFLPMWLFDVILIIYIVFRVITDRRNTYSTSRSSQRASVTRKAGYFVGVILKVTFQVMLCVRLEYGGVELYYVMLPAWLILLAATVDVGAALRHWHTASTCNGARADASDPVGAMD